MASPFQAGKVKGPTKQGDAKHRKEAVLSTSCNQQGLVGNFPVSALKSGNQLMSE